MSLLIAKSSTEWSETESSNLRGPFQPIEYSVIKKIEVVLDFRVRRVFI